MVRVGVSMLVGKGLCEEASDAGYEEGRPGTVTTSPLRLRLPGQDEVVTAPDAINDALHVLGAAIWPLETRAAPEAVGFLLAKPVLDEAESRQVMDHFLLSRAALLEVIDKAGRRPRTPGGGSLSTTDETHGVVYPELYQVLEGIDYSRFDRFHVNRGKEGTGVDEVMQVLSGSGVVLQQQLPDGGALRLEIDCPPGQGWILTYDGNLPHIGALSSATLGTKVLMQIIGPAAWEMVYL